VAEPLTPEQSQLLEANLRNREWRLSNLYYIKDKYGQKVKFQMNTVQRYLLANFWFMLLVLKSRQHGVTTFFAILYLDDCLFTPNLKAGIVAQTEDDAKEIFSDKVRFAYDNLDPLIREKVVNIVDRKDKLEFSNGSSIYVDCSLRSGTVQRLHVSEFGPMCANAPERAAEVVSGALNTVHVGSYISIESTGEGEDGKFYEYCQAALNRSLAKAKLNQKQFRFFFFGWYCDPDNVLPAGSMVITREYQEYFNEIQPKIRQLSDAGVIMPMPGGLLTDRQKAWYVAKAEEQGDNMHSQHPSIPEESFRSTAEGSYYRKQFAFLYENKRICRVPHEPRLPVNVSWDLGKDDYTALWFHQRVGAEERIIRYFEDYGEDLPFYVRYLQGLKYVWGKHFLPHDAGANRMGMVASIEQQLINLGLKNTEVITVSKDNNQEIEETRQFLMKCWIDEEHCDVGIKHLQAYRKQKDKKGRWKKEALHDEHSDGADSFRYLAVGLSSGLSSGRGSKYLKDRPKPDMRAFR
jgi:hypothetical protein